MARIRLIWRNPFEVATLTASSFAKYFEPENLQLPGLAEKWRTGTVDASETLEADFGEETDFDAVSILHDDLVAGDVVKLQGHDGAGWVDLATLAHASGVMTAYLAPYASYQRVRIEITKAAGAGTYRTLSTLILGQFYEFPVNPTRDSIDWTPEHLTKVDRVRTGELQAEVGARLEGFSCQVDFAPEEMREELKALDAAMGLHKPFLMVFNAAATNPERETLYGTLAEGVSFSGFEGPEGLRSIQFSMVESK